MRSKLKVTTWLQHSADSHPSRSMSIGHPIPELWLFQNVTLKIKGQGHGWGHRSKSQCVSNILSTHIPFVPCSHSWDTAFQNLTLEFQGQGQMTMMLHNYRSRGSLFGPEGHSQGSLLGPTFLCQGCIFGKKIHWQRVYLSSEVLSQWYIFLWKPLKIGILGPNYRLFLKISS